MAMKDEAMPLLRCLSHIRVAAEAIKRATDGLDRTDWQTGTVYYADRQLGHALRALDQARDLVRGRLAEQADQQATLPFDGDVPNSWADPRCGERWSLADLEPPPSEQTA